MAMITSILLFLIPFCSIYGQSEDLYHLIDEHGQVQIEKETELDLELGIQRPWADNVPARAVYKQSINQTGWAFLEIHTNPKLSNEEQVFSAGFIEGYLTHDLIRLSWLNTMADFCTDNVKLCHHLDNYISQNNAWVRSKINALADKDEYWHQVKLFYEQVKGVAKGFKMADSKQEITEKQILWLNLNGDFEDLQEVIKQRYNMTKSKPKLTGTGHCSALIKILPQGQDLFVSQVTWNSYQSMLRVQKKYAFSLRSIVSSKVLVPGNSMTFSSYPGIITSGDDFYLISSGLSTLETTIGNNNGSLWRYVRPNGQIFECVRSMVANRLATTGRMWAKLFSKYNSGTYNNQWMVVDYNKFQVNVQPRNQPNDLLWILEQIPNHIYANDMTDVLRSQTYWPSYNVPSFPHIFNLSGNQALVAKFGDWFTYERNPRALIFKRDHSKVTDLNSMLDLMRYNDFKHDPLSKCECNPPYSAENAIAARNDLNPANGTYPFEALGHRSHGATDAKITSIELFKNKLQFLSVSGPANNGSRGLPPFQWSKVDFGSKISHYGHPDKWNFKPLVKEWV